MINNQDTGVDTSGQVFSQEAGVEAKDQPQETLQSSCWDGKDQPQVRSSSGGYLTVNYLGWSPDLSLQRCSQVTRQGVQNTFC